MRRAPATASGALAAIFAASFERRVDRAARVGQPTDDAVLGHPLGADELAGEDDLGGDPRRQQARQANQAATGGEQAAAHLGQAEGRLAGGDDQVAGERHLEAAGQRVPLDRGDQWLRGRRLGEPGEAAAGDQRFLARGEGFEVHPGGEVATRTGEDADLQRRVGVKFIERRGDSFGDREVESVLDPRPIDGDQQRRVAPLDQHRSVGRCVRAGASVESPGRHSTGVPGDLACVLRGRAGRGRRPPGGRP